MTKFGVIFVLLLISITVDAQQRFPVSYHILASDVQFELKRQIFTQVQDEFEENILPFIEDDTFEHLANFSYLGLAGYFVDSPPYHFSDYESGYVLFNFIKVYTVYWFFDKTEYTTLRCDTDFVIWIDENSNFSVQFRNNNPIRRGSCF